MRLHTHAFSQSGEPSHRSDGAANPHFAGGALVTSVESAAEKKAEKSTAAHVVLLTVFRPLSCECRAKTQQRFNVLCKNRPRVNIPLDNLSTNVGLFTPCLVVRELTFLALLDFLMKGISL